MLKAADLSVQKKTLYYPSGESFPCRKFAGDLYRMVRDSQDPFCRKQVLILCIGSDRITGDCLGPLVGYKLQARKIPGCRVVGTLKKPVHAINLHSVIRQIDSEPVPPITIAVDAAIGHESRIGSISLSNAPLIPGQGVSKTLPQTGQIAITGIVSGDRSLDVFALQHIRMALIMELADSICLGLTTFLQTLLFP